MNHGVVWICDNTENIYKIQENFIKYLMEDWWLASGQHLFFIFSKKKVYIQKRYIKDNHSIVSVTCIDRLRRSVSFLTKIKMSFTYINNSCKIDWCKRGSFEALEVS